MAHSRATDSVESWQKLMKEHLANQVSLLPETLMLTDQGRKWTVFHALFSYKGIALGRREAIFKQFKAKRGVQANVLLKKQDRDGDTVFHSAVHHRVPKEVVQMMIKNISRRTTKSVLQLQNKRKETPLRRAFETQQWDVVELLLLTCINLKILPELTGVDTLNYRTTTLLHLAFVQGYYAAEYLRMHLNVCTQTKFRLSKVDMIESIRVLDDRGQSPWHYLSNHSDDEVIIAVVNVVVEYDIDINELFTDVSRSTLLHQMEKQSRTDLAQFLEDCGADPEKKNVHGQVPRDKRKVFEGDVQQAECAEGYEEESQEERESDSDTKSSEELSNDVELPGIEIWASPTEVSVPGHNICGLQTFAHPRQSPEHERPMDLVPSHDLAVMPDPDLPLSVEEESQYTCSRCDQIVGLPRPRRTTANYDFRYQL